MATDYVQIARDLRPIIEADAADDSPLSDAVVKSMYEAELFGASIPRETGGLELSVLDAIDVYAEISAADGSAGWCLMASSTAAAYFGAWGGDELVAEMFGDGTPIAAGQFAPKGSATPVDGGYRINGQYQFGSGINHAQWVGAGLMTEGEAPEFRLAISPLDNAQVTGNWDVLGLQSTASYDYHFDDVFVPDGATFEFFAPERLRGGPMYDLGVLVLTASGHAGFAIGLVRRALDELRIKAAGGHQRMAGHTTLADSERLQYDLGVLESRFRSAELWVRDAFRRAEAGAIAGILDNEAMIESRQATTFITQEGADIIRQAYLHAGTVGLREGPLNRCFRDIHAGTQHAVCSPMSTLDFGAHLIATAPTGDDE
ncbi:MAG: acyl-CoA dehydrogenase family protein [Acidimicrobiales bacterium]